MISILEHFGRQIGSIKTVASLIWFVLDWAPKLQPVYWRPCLRPALRGLSLPSLGQSGSAVPSSHFRMRARLATLTRAYFKLALVWLFVLSISPFPFFPVQYRLSAMWSHLHLPRLHSTQRVSSFSVSSLPHRNRFYAIYQHLTCGNFIWGIYFCMPFRVLQFVYSHSTDLLVYLLTDQEQPTTSDITTNLRLEEIPFPPLKHFAS